MSGIPVVAGYPLHAVVSYRKWTNPNGVMFTNWRGACGAEGTRSGHGPFHHAGSARRLELCPKCFPDLDWRTATYPDPVEVLS